MQPRMLTSWLRPVSQESWHRSCPGWPSPVVNLWYVPTELRPFVVSSRPKFGREAGRKCGPRVLCTIRKEGIVRGKVIGSPPEPTRSDESILTQADHANS